MTNGCIPKFSPNHVVRPYSQPSTLNNSPTLNFPLTARIPPPVRETSSSMNALPSSEPNRRRRLALRFVVLVVAFSLLAAAYWFTRPPDLVWWTSPEIKGTKHRLKALIPSGWQRLALKTDPPKVWAGSYDFEPVDNRPRFLRWILRQEKEDAMITIGVKEVAEMGGRMEDQIIRNDMQGLATVFCSRDRPDSHLWAFAFLYRSNIPAFNRTYLRICNSLRIE
jgi:hypothetical protein